MTSEKSTLVEALLRGGRILRNAFETDIQIDFKGDVNLVTEVDRGSEAAIVELIRSQHPHHDLLGEEGGAYPSGQTSNTKTWEERDHLWILDPLDGTTNYAHHFRGFSVSIAYQRQGMTVLGGVYDPIADELFFAEQGQGATLNGRPIRPSRCSRLDSSLLGSGFGYDKHLRPEYYLKFWHHFLRAKAGIRRMGSAALDLCMVASGRLDGYWEAGLQAWDSAAGALIVEEAGGRVTTYTGDNFSPFGPSAVASNGLIHDEMLQVLAECLREN
jgi:myo-inositol-1(or 4)-monophosphatase